MIAGVVTLALVLPLAAQANAGPNHATVVAAVPSGLSPDIIDERVDAIHDAGAKILVGGTFSTVQNRDSNVNIPRAYLFAFTTSTGLVDGGFQPRLDGAVTAVVAGPTAGTAYVAGYFSSVNGTTRRKVALINVADGSLVTTFQPPAFNGAIKDIAVTGGRLLVGGDFTTAGAANPRMGLASLNATTGALDSYLTVPLTGHHNWNGFGAKAPVGPDKLAVSPDGTQLVVIGNFKNAGGVLHDQIVRITLAATATISNWNTDRYQPRCASGAFDSYVRDVAWSPNGSYFVVVTTGASFAGTLCDTVARWPLAAVGAGQQPTWVDFSGGDTFLSVAISEQAIYVGGHIRWVNNSLGLGRVGAGAVGRASIAALDPVNGLPLAWNPGRHPRGFGVTEMYLTSQGLWLGSDQSWIGDFNYRRERIAFFPLAGAAPVHPTNTATLPGTVYQAGSVTGQAVNTIVKRSYAGTGAPGAATVVADTNTWSASRGAFWVGGTVFYGQGSSLYRRTFTGGAFGPAVAVDPYHDAKWDQVVTGSSPTGSTYAGMTPTFYAGINDVTGMFYTAGRLYYTAVGQQSLFWRWFTPDSGTLGTDRFTVAGSTGFSNAGGIFLNGGTLYVTDRTNGRLATRTWNNGAPSATATVVSGPGVDSADWRGRSVFVAP